MAPNCDRRTYIQRIMESARFRRKAASILIFVDFSVFNLLEWTNIDGLTEERIYPDYHFKYQQCYSNKKRIKGIDALKQVSGSSNDQGMGELLIYWELQSQKE